MGLFKSIGKALKQLAGVGVFGPVGMIASHASNNRSARRQQAANDAANQNAMNDMANRQQQGLNDARADIQRRQAVKDKERESSQAKINAGMARSNKRRIKGGIFGDDRGSGMGGPSNSRLG